MAKQLKIYNGSSSLCGCGCKTRKTNVRRRFASGHDGRRLGNQRGDGKPRIYKSNSGINSQNAKEGL
jgi:hypothetical protein